MIRILALCLIGSVFEASFSNNLQKNRCMTQRRTALADETKFLVHFDSVIIGTTVFDYSQRQDLVEIDFFEPILNSFGYILGQDRSSFVDSQVNQTMFAAWQAYRGMCNRRSLELQNVSANIDYNSKRS